MKRFINDFNRDRGTELTLENRDEKLECPINTWVTTEVDSKTQKFLVSAYVYEDFVMFLYLYDLKFDRDYNKQKDGLLQYKRAVTYRDSVMLAFENDCEFQLMPMVSYELNQLPTNGGGTHRCVPNIHECIPPESEWDDIMKMYYGEYEYLLNLVTETDRIPKALQDKELAFRKDCFQFREPISEINNLVIYLPSYKFCTHFIGISVTVPVGECDIKIPYTIAKTGEESYFIIKKLELHNMMEDFQRDYDILKENHEKALQADEENKNKYGDRSEVISLEEMRQFYSRTLLQLYILMPEEKRSLKFYTNEYLDSEIQVNNLNSDILTWYSDRGTDSDDGALYRTICHVEGYMGVVKDEYEITLLSVTDTFQFERKALFEMKSDTLEDVSKNSH